MQKKDLFTLALLLVLATSLAGCDFVGDVLEFGFWVLLIIILVVGLLIYAVFKSFFD